MEKMIIRGGATLRGAINVSGAKNATLPMMGATLLTEEPCVLRGVPNLMDVRTMGKILGALGSRTAAENGALRIVSEDMRPVVAPYELVSTMRASVCVLGPLLARRHQAKVSLPGGCVIGSRPIDLHLKGLSALGAKITVEHGYVVARAKALRGANIYLGGPFGSSVLATQNVMMAATLAKGRTVIENAACEPEVQNLAEMLTFMGAKISGAGTPRVVIEGVRELGGVECAVIPDRIEAGTFLVIAAATRSPVTITGVRLDHLSAVVDKLRDVGVEIHADGKRGIRVRAPRTFRPVDLIVLTYPGFPTDLQAVFMALLALGDGVSVITERVFPDRFMHVAELGRMGAKIRKEGSAAIVEGVRKLHGAPVMASDLRASAALVVAGLVADGVTEVNRIYHLDRGYERIDEKLVRLGARIHREKV
ncbi:MAG: UDP-N-acetylglucosamine 1-carboxyvinyltransferase [Planctomycetota bacterium]